MYNDNKNNGKVLRMIFPGFVATEESNREEPLGTIYPEEEAFVQNVAQKRRSDFTAGRLCARKALTQLGIDKFPIKMDKDRSPVWPAEIVGSISHTDGFCGVAVALKSKAESLGLDVERLDRLSDKCWYLICTDSEISWIKSLPENRQQDIATLIFSAKECFYKCQYIINKCWVGFHDAEISVNPGLDNGKFEIRLLKDISNSFLKETSFKGKYVFKDRFIFSGMTL
ncbi:MAG: 4'-phosphopantetheinyl transferase family protein [Candidatus Anammoxibacter sp.]